MSICKETAQQAGFLILQIVCANLLIGESAQQASRIPRFPDSPNSPFPVLKIAVLGLLYVNLIAYCLNCIPRDWSDNNDVINKLMMIS